MEQLTEIVPVTPEEARFDMRFEYTAALQKQWQRHPLRRSRRVLRSLRPFLGVFLILLGIVNLWLMFRAARNAFSVYSRAVTFSDYVSYWGPDLVLPVLCFVLGTMQFFMDAISRWAMMKRLRTMNGPEPWPVRYLFGEDAVTNTFGDAAQTLPYERIKKAEDAGDFLLLWVGKMAFRLPKSSLTKGTPEDLLSFLLEKIPAKR